MEWIGYLIAGVVGVVVGVFAEHKLDILKPKHIARIEAKIDQIEAWIKRKT